MNCNNKEMFYSRLTCAESWNRCKIWNCRDAMREQSEPESRCIRYRLMKKMPESKWIKC